MALKTFPNTFNGLQKKAFPRYSASPPTKKKSLEDQAIPTRQGPLEGMESMYGKDPEVELANLLRVFQDLFQKLGAKPPICNNSSTIILEYWPIQLGNPFHACFSCLLKALGIYLKAWAETLNNNTCLCYFTDKSQSFSDSLGLSGAITSPFQEVSPSSR